MSERERDDGFGWVIGILFLLLVVAAAGFGLFSYRRMERARMEAIMALERAQMAQEQARVEAERARDIAEQARKDTEAARSKSDEETSHQAPAGSTSP